MAVVVVSLEILGSTKRYNRIRKKIDEHVHGTTLSLQRHHHAYTCIDATVNMAGDIFLETVLLLALEPS